MLLLSNRLRLLGHRGLDNFLLRVLVFRKLQPVLRHVDQDRSLSFKRDGARKASKLGQKRVNLRHDGPQGVSGSVPTWPFFSS